jgi:hypothetical protein
MDKWQELKAYVMDERDRLVAYATTEQDGSCVEQRILRKMAELERSEPAAASVPLSTAAAPNWPTPFTVEQLHRYAGLKLSLRCEQTNGQERDWSDTAIILARQLLALSEAT